MIFFLGEHCESKYQEVKPSHIMCLPDPDKMPDSVGVISEAEKKEIVDVHNQLRSSVQPPATNMRKMVCE